jgi:integrase
MALSNSAVRNAKPRPTAWKLADEKGLYLFVKPNGSKLWRVKYRHLGKEGKLAIGSYPEVTLKEARASRDQARKLLEQGIDPSHAKREARIKARIGAANTFKAVADEYIAKREREGLAEVTLAKSRWLLGQLAPKLGARPVAEIAPHELLDVLRKVERAGKRETARRLRSFASRIFRYAVATARAATDPAALLDQALVAPIVRHHAAITDPKVLGDLLRAIEAYAGQPVTKWAMKFSAQVFQRPGEIRKAEWSEIDFDKAIWAIPAARMKQREPHHVPLSPQVIDLLREVHAVTGAGRYVFPSASSSKQALSENGVNQALRRMGYGGEVMTAHGFRSTASSLLNESGKWNPDAIERALSHKEANTVRAAYHRSAYWHERVAMANWWSDRLDMLRDGAKILPLPVNAA